MTFKGMHKTLQQPLSKLEKATTSRSIVLRWSDQRNSSWRLTYNDQALFSVPEIDNISRRSISSNNEGNMLLKSLASR
ncbi:hypothetical protein EJD97_017628, partial [Solanum chilense]